jgi:hypothetical protein
LRLSVSRGGRVADVGVLPSGDDGIAATIAGMQAAVDHAVYGRDSAAVFAAACTAASMVAGGHAGRAVYSFCADGFRYRSDPPGLELVRLPAGLLAERQSSGVAWCDCDDRAVLGCSLLWALRLLGGAPGVSPVFVTVGRRARGLGGRFEHVFWGSIADGAALVPANVVPADPQENVPFGQWGRAVSRVKLWRLSPSNPYL